MPSALLIVWLGLWELTAAPCGDGFFAVGPKAEMKCWHRLEEGISLNQACYPFSAINLEIVIRVQPLQPPPREASPGASKPV